MSHRLSTEMRTSFEILDRDADTRRLTMAPAVVVGPIGDGLRQRHDGHVDMLLIHACRHSTAASNSKDLNSKHLNNRAIFSRVGALHIALQRHDARSDPAFRHEQPDQLEIFRSWRLRTADSGCTRAALI